MSTKSDLEVVLAINKKMYPTWMLLILLCKLDIASARVFTEPQVIDYVHRVLGERIKEELYGLRRK